MTYFKTFPKTDYEYTKRISKKAVDILRRNIVVKELLDSNQYELLYINESQTPQSLAFKLYGDAKLQWSILLFNEIINPFYDWPVTEDKLIRRMNAKYKGISLFVTNNEITDLDSVSVNTKTENASYVVGQQVYVYESGGDPIGNGVLYEYDRTVGHMKIDGVDSFTLSAGDYITDVNGNKKMFIGRKFDVVRDSLWYFIDDDKIIRNPYEKIGTTKLIDLYVSKDSLAITNQNINIVSIDQYEKALNDNNRLIKIPNRSVISAMNLKLRELNLR